MRKVYWFICLLVYWSNGFGQGVEMKLAEAVQRFEKDSQMRHAIIGFAVMDAKTGQMIFGRNEQIGLAPASTQKIITGAAAFELLGNDYRYKTIVAHSGKVDGSTLYGSLFIIGFGDPTFGSWRYKETRDTVVLEQLAQAIKKRGIKTITGAVYVQRSLFSYQSIPDGWIWQDIGNYYGAGAHQFNWKENQYDLILRSGDKIGDSVAVADTDNEFTRNRYVNQLMAAAKGTGDNAYIYLPVGPNGHSYLSGTIPVSEKAFSISGSVQQPDVQFTRDLSRRLLRHSIRLGESGKRSASEGDLINLNLHNTIHAYYSPTVDSLHYWFMRRSINLYGEALVKTIAFEKTGYGHTDTGVRIIRNFWAEKGIDRAALNIIDGSGLSPQNRITADALVKALQFAKTRPWYRSFYESLPTYNGMKLKSGSIGGARSFAGYHTSGQGKEYVIAIIVNNYTGSSGEIVKKMYKVLDELK